MAVTDSTLPRITKSFPSLLVREYQEASFERELGGIHKQLVILDMKRMIQRLIGWEVAEREREEDTVKLTRKPLPKWFQCHHFSICLLYTQGDAVNSVIVSEERAGWCRWTNWSVYRAWANSTQGNVLLSSEGFALKLESLAEEVRTLKCYWFCLGKWEYRLQGEEKGKR